jgi:hypothetical protein
VAPDVEPGEPSNVVGAGEEDYPCRCLCRGFSQITLTVPWRRITLHFSQILFTLGLTFIEALLPVDA